MTPYILLGLLIVPLLEIAAFIVIGGWIGLWPTLALILLTALIGTALLRHQGVATLRQARASLRRGEMPLAEAMHGLFLALAGVLLLTPGFVTDSAGLLLFVPPLRSRLARRLLAMLPGDLVRQPPYDAGPAQERGEVIETSYRDVTPPASPSPWHKPIE